MDEPPDRLDERDTSADEDREDDGEAGDPLAAGGTEEEGDTERNGGERVARVVDEIREERHRVRESAKIAACAPAAMPSTTRLDVTARTPARERRIDRSTRPCECPCRAVMSSWSWSWSCAGAIRLPPRARSVGSRGASSPTRPARSRAPRGRARQPGSDPVEIERDVTATRAVHRPPVGLAARPMSTASIRPPGFRTRRISASSAERVVREMVEDERAQHDVERRVGERELFARADGEGDVDAHGVPSCAPERAARPTDRRRARLRRRRRGVRPRSRASPCRSRHRAPPRRRSRARGRSGVRGTPVRGRARRPRA